MRKVYSREKKMFGRLGFQVGSHKSKKLEIYSSRIHTNPRSLKSNSAEFTLIGEA
jgi:hypothetical protein